MSKYRFNISNYHAIENADILVDGITVLAGPNGSGKSTISKWLYYMVDVATRFDEYVGKGVNMNSNIVCRFLHVLFEKYGGIAVVELKS